MKYSILKEFQMPAMQVIIITLTTQIIQTIQIIMSHKTQVY